MGPEDDNGVTAGLQLTVITLVLDVVEVEAMGDNLNSVLRLDFQFILLGRSLP
jgi:hypothetical protein